MKEQLLTVQELSCFLNVHFKTVYKWVVQGRLPHRKINGTIRFEKDEIEAFQKKYKPVEIYQPELLLKLDVPLEAYDKMLLKGDSAVSNKKQRWNYGFGSIYTRVTKGGLFRWYLDYWDGQGNRIQKIVSDAQSKEEALIVLQNRVFEKFSRENNLQQKPKRIRFSDFSAMYLEDYAKDNKTLESWRTDKSYLKGIKKFFEDRYLDEITTHDVEKYKSARLRQGVRQSTVNRCLAIIRKMFFLAVDWKYLEHKQLIKVKLYSEKDNLVERILTREEEACLFQEIPQHLKPIVMVALNTGMRRGEILKLRWNQIDLKARRIRVEKTKSKRIRIININAGLMRELSELRSKSRGSDYLFLNEKTRRPITDVKTAFKSACRRAGVSNLRFHDLRHTFATRLVENGVDLITIKELLGHSSVTITERYTHSFEDQKRKAVELLSDEQPEEDEIPKILLHQSDMEDKTQEEKRLISLFSVN